MSEKTLWPSPRCPEPITLTEPRPIFAKDLVNLTRDFAEIIEVQLYGASGVRPSVHERRVHGERGAPRGSGLRVFSLF